MENSALRLWKFRRYPGVLENKSLAFNKRNVFLTVKSTVEEAKSFERRILGTKRRSVECPGSENICSSSNSPTSVPTEENILLISNQFQGLLQLEAPARIPKLKYLLNFHRRGCVSPWQVEIFSPSRKEVTGGTDTSVHGTTCAWS